MINKDIQELAVLTKNLLKKFSDGKVSYDMAMSELLTLEKRYNQLNIEKNHLQIKDIVSSVLNINNCENFSMYTGCFTFANKQLLSSQYSGDSKTHESIIALVKNLHILQKKTKLEIIEPMGDLKQRIFIYTNADNETTSAIIALSSSSFFSKKYFKHFARNINKMILLSSNEYNALTKFDYIENFTNKSIENGYKLRCEIFYFFNIFNIFNHYGSETILAVSEQILNTIESNFNGNSEVITISLNEYVVFEKVDKHTVENIGSSNFSFSYKDIIIPHKSKVLYLNAKNSFFFFTDFLFSMK